MEKMDFLILSVGRVATQAIWRYTSCHPNLHVPSFYTTDELIKANKYQELSRVYKNIPDDKLKGIVVHSEEALQALTSLSYSKVIHMVRNPYDMAKSLYNHTLHRSYIFDFVKHPGTFDTFFKKKTASLQFYSIGSPAYKKCKSLKIIDFSDMTNQNIDHTMNTVFDFLGVDNIGNKELFHIKQQDDTSAMMRGILPPNIIHSKGKLELVMAYEGDKIFSEDPHFLFVGAIEDTSSAFSNFSFSLQNKKLNIFIKKHQLSAMEEKERSLLQNHLHSNIEKALDVWGKCIDNLETVIGPQRILSLSQGQHQFLDHHINTDVNKMTTKFSGLKSKWS